MYRFAWIRRIADFLLMYRTWIMFALNKENAICSFKTYVAALIFQEKIASLRNLEKSIAINSERAFDRSRYISY